jgi:hypothetical protein
VHLRPVTAAVSRRCGRLCMGVGVVVRVGTTQTHPREQLSAMRTQSGSSSRCQTSLVCRASGEAPVVVIRLGLRGRSGSGYGGTYRAVNIPERVGAGLVASDFPHKCVHHGLQTVARRFCCSTRQSAVFPKFNPPQLLSTSDMVKPGNAYVGGVCMCVCVRQQRLTRTCVTRAQTWHP